jgi:hypothetical protein
MVNDCVKYVCDSPSRFKEPVEFAETGAVAMAIRYDGLAVTESPTTSIRSKTVFATSHTPKL